MNKMQLEQSSVRSHLVLPTSDLIYSLSPGVGHLCSQPGDQPGNRSLPVYGVRRHLGGDPGHRHSSAGHLLHPGGRTRVAAREDETSIMGGPHLLGTG